MFIIHKHMKQETHSRAKAEHLLYLRLQTAYNSQENVSKVPDLQIAKQETVDRRHCEPELQGVSHCRLHFKDLIPVVSPVSDEHQVTNLRRVDLLILRS